MTLYYQLLVIYFVSFVIYILLKLQFAGFDWNKITQDSIFYLFLILFGYALFTTVYYLIKKSEIIIDESKILLESRFKSIEIPIDKIEYVRVKREHISYLSGFLRKVKIKLKDQNKAIIIRSFDFENDEELFNELLRIRESIYKSIEVKNA